MKINVSIQRRRSVDFELLIDSFAKYLKISKGLAPRSINEYCKNVTYFLLPHCKRSRINLEQMSSKKILNYFLEFAHSNTASNTQQITYALRSFFRYLKQDHLIKEDLASIVPSVANRKRTSFPEALSLEMTNKLLESCDRKNSLGKRNYAILLLMITLGLRSCEVSSLELDDLDWDRGELIVRSKGSEDRFPIFQKLGKSLVDYLKYGRPNCESKRVFIRSIHPYQGITTSCLRAIVSTALIRCNLKPKKRGTHLLRHSFAMQLLERGATLEEIGVTLRHKNIETTSIYAKSNFIKLKEIVQPWPQFVNLEESHD